MTIAQAVHVLAPGAIVVPPLADEHTTGRSRRPLSATSSRRSFKLQSLAEANGIVTDSATAHDALADAMTTMALMRLMRERAPEIVDAMIELASKWSVIERLETSSRPGEDGQFQPLALIKVIGGSTLATPVMALGASVHQPGRFTAVDLAFDPAQYLSLDEDELIQLMAEHRHAFLNIKPMASRSSYRWVLVVRSRLARCASFSRQPTLISMRFGAEWRRSMLQGMR